MKIKPFHRIGPVVKDATKVIINWEQVLGIAPWHPLTSETPMP